MAVPAGGEIVVYNSSVKRAEARVAIGLDYPALTAERKVDFGAGATLDADDFWFTQLAGKPDVSSNLLNLRTKGGPPYEIVRTREGWVPSDPSQPFQLSVTCTFQNVDPIYSSIIVFGSLDQTFGTAAYDALQIDHVGSVESDAYPGSAADINKVELLAEGSVRESFAHAGGSNIYEIEWDPAKAVNASILTIKRGGVTKYSSDTSKRPTYLSMGWSWPTVIDRTTGQGIPGNSSTTTIMSISEVKCTQLGALGYESRAYPGWTSANAGGTTVANSGEGERFSEDGETWAIMPQGQIKNFSVERSRQSEADTFTLTVFCADHSNPDGSDVVQASDRYIERPITIDTRVTDQSATTAWKRQIAGRIKSVEFVDTPEGATAVLRGRCRVMDGLDVFMSKVYSGEAGPIDAVNTGFTFDGILQDMVEVADAIDGGPLGARDKDITAPAVVPSALSTGGESLLPVFANICDQLAQEFWVEYETSSTGRYGNLHVNAWTLGSGSAGYAFGSEDFISGRVKEDGSVGPGQISLRQNLETIDGSTLVNFWHLPFSGVFPTMPYPAKGRILSDTIAFSKNLQATVLLALTDKDGGTINGGIPQHRWRAENAARRTVTFTCLGHDWLEPVDEISVEVRGALTNETWVVERIRLDFEDSRLTSRVTGMTGDWTTAVLRGGAT